MTKEDKKESQILCVFCNAPWSPDMQITSWYASEGCNTCGFGSELTADIEIYCTNCKRLVYKKEGIKA